MKKGTIILLVTILSLGLAVWSCEKREGEIKQAESETTALITPARAVEITANTALTLGDIRPLLKAKIEALKREEERILALVPQAKENLAFLQQLSKDPEVATYLEMSSKFLSFDKGDKIQMWWFADRKQVIITCSGEGSVTEITPQTKPRTIEAFAELTPSEICLAIKKELEQ